MLGAYGVQLGRDQLGPDEEAGGEHEVGGDRHVVELGRDGRPEVGLVAQHEVGPVLLDSADTAAAIRRAPREAKFAANSTSAARASVTSSGVRSRSAGAPAWCGAGLVANAGEAGRLDRRDEPARTRDEDLVARGLGCPRQREQGREVAEPADERDEDAHRHDA